MVMLVNYGDDMSFARAVRHRVQSLDHAAKPCPGSELPMISPGRRRRELARESAECPWRQLGLRTRWGRRHRFRPLPAHCRLPSGVRRRGVAFRLTVNRLALASNYVLGGSTRS